MKEIAQGILKSGTFIRKKYSGLLIACLGAWIVSLIDCSADLFLAGQYLSEEAISAISLVEPICSIIEFMAYLVSVGFVVLYSRANGAGDKDKAYKLAGQGFICSIIISIILVVGLIILEEPLLRFYGASSEISSLAHDYYVAEIIFAGLYPIYYIIFQLIGIEGDGAIAFIACTCSAITNIISSILLVGPLGVKGLAFGTVIGTVICILIYCIHFLKKSNSIRLKWYFNMKEVWEAIKISSSTSITFIYIAIVDLIMNKIVISFFGDEFLPAYAVINFIINFGAMFGALHDGHSGFLGVAYGENNPASVKRVMKISVTAALIISVIALIGLEIIAPYMATLFGITTPEVAEASIYATKVLALAFPATAFVYLFTSYYPIMGKVIYGHIVSCLYMLVTPIIIAIPLGKLFGFTGLSWGFMATPIVSLLITTAIIKIKYGNQGDILLLAKTNEESFAYDILLNKESIACLCNKVKEDLDKKNVPANVVNEIQLVIEESYMTILEKNSKKKVLSECDILVSPDRIRLFTRDNGCIFNITDANANINSFRSYVLGLLMAKNEKRSNTTTVSFNRNSYIWELKEDK